MDNHANAQLHPFTATRLEPAALLRAYPLVRAHNPNLDLKDWLSYARTFSRKNPTTSGLIGMIDSRSYVRGLFAYCTEYHLAYRNTLRISNLIMCHLPGSALTLAVVNAMGHLATRTNVSAIMVAAGTQCPPILREALTSQGFTCGSEHMFIRHEAASLLPMPELAAQPMALKA